MSITKSYNKYTDTYYAYDTTYEWDEKRQKKVQRKRCVGKFDPATGEVIPNGKVGRPMGMVPLIRQSQQSGPQISTADIDRITNSYAKIEHAMQDLTSSIATIEYAQKELMSNVRDLKGVVDRISSSKEEE